MQTETQKWIEAGKSIAKDANAKVACPRCAEADLEVEDVPNPNAPDQIERIMRCPSCGAMNALRLKR